SRCRTGGSFLPRRGSGNDAHCEPRRRRISSRSNYSHHRWAVHHRSARHAHHASLGRGSVAARDRQSRCGACLSNHHRATGRLRRQPAAGDIQMTDLDRWVMQVRTRRGAVVCVRPLRPDDREREIAFINSLSERSRYFRLFTPLKVLPRHLIDRLMDIDYLHRMAFVATTLKDGVEQFVGVARYGEADQPGTAELGVSVADTWQRCGIASLLMQQLIRYAREHDINRMT